MSRSERSVRGVVIRDELKPGDLGAIVHFHGSLYAKEYGFDETFEAYVAGPMAEFVLARRDRDRLWIAESGDRLLGCVAIVGTSETEAQLRWFLVDPAARGGGLGTVLLEQAIGFARERGYRTVFLWTVTALVAAAHLYDKFGFRKVEEKPGKWGVEVVEEKYVLDLETRSR